MSNIDAITGKPLLRSMIGEHIWRIKESDPEAFKREVREYFARGYPGWTTIRAKYPYIFLRDDREQSV
ncbi:hypothetical protein NLX78_07935 [Paenibacillus sp. Lou8.1]|uniref:hypothetical protein n=1 Tax=Paenibacillus sp. Lou8.1 TaxID=2962041 RepID=UPI0020B76B20|nr:hypothetical protein [Paenibacillus sp. Lou8.1]MCP3807162.1 hypothetical protein [Paenibacillus sp. Lou8.1]